jgi:hypothetical protein
MLGEADATCYFEIAQAIKSDTLPRKERGCVRNRRRITS